MRSVSVKPSEDNYMHDEALTPETHRHDYDMQLAEILKDVLARILRLRSRKLYTGNHQKTITCTRLEALTPEHTRRNDYDMQLAEILKDRSCENS